MSNMIFVYSPKGEPFEATHVNARDLVNHAGWSYSPPAGNNTPASAPDAPSEKQEEREERSEKREERQSGKTAKKLPVIEDVSSAPAETAPVETPAETPAETAPAETAPAETPEAETTAPAAE